MKNKKRQRWCVLEDDDAIHVVPDFDIKAHGIDKITKNKLYLANTNCPCKPEIDFSGRKPLITHNSFINIKMLDESLKKL